MMLSALILSAAMLGQSYPGGHVPSSPPPGVQVEPIPPGLPVPAKPTPQVPVLSVAACGEFTIIRSYVERVRIVRRAYRPFRGWFRGVRGGCG